MSLRGHFVIKGSFSSFSSFFKKTSKISTNTYRTKLNLCGLNWVTNLNINKISDDLITQHYIPILSTKYTTFITLLKAASHSDDLDCVIILVPCRSSCRDVVQTKRKKYTTKHYYYWPLRNASHYPIRPTEPNTCQLFCHWKKRSTKAKHYNLIRRQGIQPRGLIVSDKHRRLIQIQEK